MDSALIRQYIDDPSHLLRDIDSALENAPLDALPFLSLEPGTPVERSVVDGTPRHTVMELLLARSARALHERCCVGLRYCELRENQRETIALIQTLADSLLSAILKFPVPLATVASYCVLSRFMDRLCECGGEAEK